MKKALTLSMLVGLAVVTSWYVAAAQDSPTPAGSESRGGRSSASGGLTPVDAVPQYSTGSSAYQVPAPSQTDVLKRELLELTETAASLMDEEELQAEVERARERAVTMTANQRLEEIRRELAELAMNYQGTEAAATAEAMLEVEISNEATADGEEQASAETPI